MAVGLRSKKEFLNGRECFRRWFETSSLYKAQKVLYSDGVTNPKTGKAPTPMGIWYSAWSWGLQNLDEAKKMVKDVYRVHGEILDDAEWTEIVKSKAKYLYSVKKYQQFLQNNGF